MWGRPSGRGRYRDSSEFSLDIAGQEDGVVVSGVPTPAVLIGPSSYHWDIL